MSPWLLGVGSLSAPSDLGARYIATDHPGKATTTVHTNGLYDAEVSRLHFKALSDLIGPAPIYGNFGYGENDNVNSITVAASIEYPTNVLTPLTFNGGDPTALIVPGGLVEADTHALTIPYHSLFKVRTRTTVADGDRYYAPMDTNDSLGEGAVRDEAALESLLTSGTITPVYGQNCNGPLGILSSGPYRPTVAGVGDSITFGLNVSRDQSFIARACIDADIAFFQLGQPIELALGFATVQARHNRIRLIAKCSTANEAYGTNDFNQSRTAAETNQNRLTIWNACKAAGVTRVFANTVVPLTTSGNGWINEAGQTPHANTAARLAHNVWLLGGAPLDPILLTPVAVGTPGALTCDVYNPSKVKILTGTGPPHPLFAVFDTAGSVSLSSNLSVWAFPGGSALTNDGIHPVAGNVQMAAAIDTSLFV